MRLFIALEPPSLVKKELLDALRYLQGIKHSGINWVKPENLHLTVNFIGEVAEHRLIELKKLVAKQVQRYSSPILAAEGIELYPYRFPRLIWLKLGGDESVLKALNRQTLSSLRALGIEADAKALKLHVTLGRIKSQQSPEFERAALSYKISNQNLAWNTLSLYKSLLRPDGPKYEVIEQYDLIKTEE
ncbi:MAG: RNA 2',3'-cyclic phosphodiesterase [Candidatus Cloacimonetes bacterium]|nr:RNA 2',3'-cyclic phosphodiesterase [Candidatus Cloacimonadota bacterium]MCK9332927.1 RNA 2',3'-cyclic phosphodiesterase [Candidatus Cloacimonadota bacterium]MDD4688095.1 RNA 2',3'-cyclic phosphodiesterase [Candidatus Cloacimonadota bacterium]